MGAYRFYRSYLDAAHQAHTWIKEIWIMFKMTLSIKTKLLLVLPTDHGDVKQNGQVMEISLKGLQNIFCGYGTKN
jgi:hypothetical protein